MKKRNTLLAAGFTFTVVFGAAIGLTACGNTHTHSVESVAKKDSTCTEAGYEAYYKCTGCDKIFSDEEGKNEITAPTAIAAGHKIGAVPQKDATCTETGLEAHYKCSGCDALFSDAEGKNSITAATVIPVTPHKIVDVSQKRPTCTEAGYEEHYKCDDCGALYADEEGKEPIEAPTAIPARHRIGEVAAKAPTCVEAGYELHYKCSICTLLFSDEEGTEPIEAPTAVPATGVHTYGYNYTSENVPAPVATGGTLAATCTGCERAENVDYDKGIEGFVVNQATPDKIESAGTIYGKTDRVFAVAIKVTKPGTYKLSLNTVAQMTENPITLNNLSIGNYGGFSAMTGIIMNGAWNALPPAAANVNKFKSKITVEGFGKGVAFESVTVTLADDDLDYTKDNYIGLYFGTTDSNGQTKHILIDMEMPEETPAPAALQNEALPEQKND